MTALVALAVGVAAQYGLDPGLFCRLVERESDWNPRAFTASSVGLAQINQKAWGWWPADPFEPYANLEKGALILRWNLAYRFEMGAEQVPLAVASYTLGHGAVNQLLALHGDNWRDGLSEPVRAYVEAIVERTNYTLETLESAEWTLLQPLDLWSYERGNCWIVGDYGPFQLFAEGSSFEAARDEFCRVLIEAAESAAHIGEKYGDYLGRVNKSDSASDQVWQDAATHE